MAKTESTAVNDLIKIATTQTPLRRDPSDDLMFAVPSKKDRSTKQQNALVPRGADVPLSRVPHGTQEHAIAMPALKAPRAPLSPLASSPPSFAPSPVETAPEFLSDSFEALTSTSGPSLESLEIATAEVAAIEPRSPMPSEYPVVSAVHSQPLARAPLPKLGEVEPMWAEDSLDVDVEVAPVHSDSTAQLAKPRTTLAWLIKLAPLAGAMIVLGVSVGGYLVFDGQSGKQRTAAAADPTGGAVPSALAPAIAAPAAVAAVTPPNLAAAPSITTPAPTAAAIAGRPTLVDIRIDSKPSGATVTLVDRGKQTFLGTTPISTAVDPSRAYDVVFSHPRRPTQTAHLDPKQANRVAVTLGRTGTPSTTTEIARPAAPSAPVSKITKPAKLEKVAKLETTEHATAETASATEKAVGGNGTLMISSKPPCEIHVDGKSTGLMTPQRSLSLSAGKHKITLVNPGLKIKKSVAVEITANESTKVIQDLTELTK